jgi:hypothetical protein
MDLHDHQRRALRLKLRDILWKFKPDADVIEVGQATLGIMRILDRAPLGTLMDIPAVPNCGCWQCVLRLEATIVQQHARWSIEAMEELELD